MTKAFHLKNPPKTLAARTVPNPYPKRPEELRLNGVGLLGVGGEPPPYGESAPTGAKHLKSETCSTSARPGLADELNAARTGDAPPPDLPIDEVEAYRLGAQLFRELEKKHGENPVGRMALPDSPSKNRKFP